MQTPDDPAQPTDPEPTDWVMPPEDGATQPDATADPVTSAAPSGGRSNRLRRGATAAALVATGLVVGGGIGYAATGHSNNDHTAARLPSTTGFAGPQLSGGVADEQHIQGTLSAKSGSSITVKSTSGSASYTVTSSTQIVRDGQTATLADVKVGDPVLVHVIPASTGSGMVVERLFAGTSATDTGPGGFGGPGGAPPMGGYGTTPGDDGTNTSST